VRWDALTVLPHFEQQPRVLEQSERRLLAAGRRSFFQGLGWRRTTLQQPAWQPMPGAPWLSPATTRLGTAPDIATVDDAGCPVLDFRLLPACGHQDTPQQAIATSTPRCRCWRMRLSDVGWWPIIQGRGR